MFKAQSESREWKCYLQDMIKRSEKVLAYTDKLNQEALLADDILYEATLHNIQLIAQAATHIPIDVQEDHPEIPWRAIIGTRNRLVHEYLSVSDSVVWSIIEEAIPSLLPQLRNLISTYRFDQKRDSCE